MEETHQRWDLRRQLGWELRRLDGRNASWKLSGADRRKFGRKFRRVDGGITRGGLGEDQARDGD